MNKLLKEIRKEGFGFSGVEPDDFRCLRIRWERKWTVVYRTLLIVYNVAWLTADVATNPSPRYLLFLSNWMQIITCLYFALALSLVVTPDRACSAKRNHNGDVRTAESAGTTTAEATLPVAHKTTWVVRNVASLSHGVALAYWIAVATRLFNAPAHLLHFSVHAHAVQPLLVTFDVLAGCVPVRALHVLHGHAMALVYILVNLLMHWTGVSSAVYPEILDWSRAPGVAGAVCACFLLFGVPLVHGVNYAGYRFIASRFPSSRDDVAVVSRTTA